MELPKSASDVREFIGSDFSKIQFGEPDGKPSDDDVYVLSAHDLLSAFQNLIDAHQDACSEPLNNGDKHGP